MIIILVQNSHYVSCIIFQQMACQRIFIRHGGHWDKADYIGGDEFLIYMPLDQIYLESIIREIKEQVGNDGGGGYTLFYVISVGDGRKVKVLVKTEVDLLRLIIEQKDEPIVYVIEKGKQPTTSGRTQATHHDSINESPEEEAEMMSLGKEVDELVTIDDEPLELGDSYGDEDELESSDEERCEEIFDVLAAEFSAWIRQLGHIDKVIGHRSFSSKHQYRSDNGSRADDSTHEPINWVIPLLTCDSELLLDWVEPSRTQVGELSVGSIFLTKDDLSIAVGMYHMENYVEYKTERSCTSRLGYVCKHDNGCPFLVHAVQNLTLWRIIKVNKTHTCHLDLNRTTPRLVPARVIGKYFSQRLVDEGVELKLKDMIGEMHRNFGIEMDYSFALRARNIAIDFIYGDFNKSYQMLPSYLHLLREHNPGTIYDIQTAHDGEFQHMFVALPQSMHAFNNHLLRPVIMIDETHMKGKNKGICFVAVTKGYFLLQLDLVRLRTRNRGPGF